MKTKFINEQRIVPDRPKWNACRTQYALASEMEEGYLEFIPSPRPEGQRVRMSYAITEEVIRQVWNIVE